jgi:hypothetical protein
MRRASINRTRIRAGAPSTAAVAVDGLTTQAADVPVVVAGTAVETAEPVAPIMRRTSREARRKAKENVPMRLALIRRLRARRVIIRAAVIAAARSLAAVARGVQIVAETAVVSRAVRVRAADAAAVNPAEAALAEAVRAADFRA